MVHGIKDTRGNIKIHYSQLEGGTSATLCTCEMTKLIYKIGCLMPAALI